MRHGHWTALLAAGCLALSGVAMAQPAPPAGADNPPDQPQQQQSPPSTAPGEGGPMYMRRGGPHHMPPGWRGHETMRGAWVGIAVSRAEPALSHQLHLPDGVGLVVDHVVPGSPAEKDGLKQYDVLQKLDDQLLINDEQLSTLVRMHKAGDQVTLTVLREGQPTQVKVTLAEHEFPMMMHPFGMHRGGPPHGMEGPGDHRGPHAQPDQPSGPEHQHPDGNQGNPPDQQP